MKKTSILLLPLILLNLSACQQNNPQTTYTKEIVNQILDNLLSNVYVDARVTQTSTYPSGYESYNSSTTYTFKRQYSSYLDGNNSYFTATRFKEKDIEKTYVKGNDGKAYIEVINENNEVTTTPLISSGTYVNYSKNFTNPFEYVDTSDISINDLTLSNLKANQVIKHYFPSLQMNVNNAKFIYQNEVATGLEIEISPKEIVYEEFNGYVVTSLLESKMEISFRYDLPYITHLKANETKYEEVDNAFNNLTNNNYTILLRSDSFSEDALFYVSDSFAYLHFNAEANYMNEGDIIYIKNLNEETYSKYIYSLEDNSLILMGSSIKKEKIFPSFDKIKSELFNKSSDNQYFMDFARAKLNAENLLIPEFNLFPTNSKSCFISLNNGNISHISVSIDTSTVTNISQTIFDIGNTNIPQYFDSTLLVG